jgi:hypothetical protein
MMAAAHLSLPACCCSNLAAEECPGEIRRGKEEEEALLNEKTNCFVCPEFIYSTI